MVNEKEKELKEIVIPEEDGIFKILTHQIRRNIIKKLAERDLSFSELKDALDPIDSPTLSYHLKNMGQFLNQKKSKYSLSDVGTAAMFLLTKTDQSIKISKTLRNFHIVFGVTYICWVLAYCLTIYLAIRSDLTLMEQIILFTILTLITIFNMSVIGWLRSKYFKKKLIKQENTS